MSNTVPTSSSTQERITATRITPGMVIAVEKRGEQLVSTRRRTGVLHATVQDKPTAKPLPGEHTTRYDIVTDLGTIERAAPSQTFPLINAPQVPAGAPNASALVVAGTVVAMVERHDLVTDEPASCTDQYGHTPGIPGCPVTVANCNGVPMELAGTIEEHPVRTGPDACGADEIGTEIADRVAIRHTVTDVRAGYSDPARNRGVREVSTWSMLVDDHRVTVVRYEARDTLMSTVRPYASVLVDGDHVDRIPASKLEYGTARVVWDFLTELATATPIGPEAPAAPAPTENLGSALAALIGDDTAPAVDQVDAPAVAEVAPAPGPDTSIMQRGAVRVQLTDAAGTVVRDWTRPTWNGGIRDSECVVREIARQEGAPYSGRKPERTGTPGTVTDTYTRVWASSFGMLTATVTRPVPAITEPAESAPAGLPIGSRVLVDQPGHRPFVSVLRQVDDPRFRRAGWLAVNIPEGAGIQVKGDQLTPAPEGAELGYLVDLVDAPAVTVTIEERSSGTPKLAPSPDAPYAPAAPVVPVIERPDVPAGMPYVVDAPDYDGTVRTMPAVDISAALRGKAGFLAHWFPGVKFSVRTSGGTVDIHWTGGPSADLVDLVAGMWWGKDRDSLRECDTYRGTVLYVAADGTETAYRLSPMYVHTHRTAGPDDAARGRRFLPAGGPKYGAEYSWDEVADPYGRPVIGGSPDEVARQLASRGADEWTRTGHDTRPECPVERCALAAGHPYPGMHRDDYGRAFLAALPAGGDEGDQGGDGGQPTDVDPTGPAPAGDQADERPTFRTWEELAAWIGGADVPALLDPARYAVTRPVDVPTWSAPAVPAVAVSFTCPAHGVVPVPVNIDSEQAGRIRQEHQECTAGDPFGLHASEKRDTGAARLAASLVASGWTAEEAENATAPHPGRMFTVTNDALGNIRVHRAGCRDIGRHSSGGGTHWDVRAEDVRGVVLDMWPDEATADNWREYNDLQVMDCAGELPEVADQVDAPKVAETAPAPIAEIRPTITVRPWVTAHVDEVPAVAEPAPVKSGPVKVADLVDGDRVHVYGVNEYGNPTHTAGYVSGSAGEVIVRGRTKSGRVSKSDKNARPGLLVQLSENPGGWNGWRMTVITTPDAMAEHVTDGDAHQFRPESEAGNPYLCRTRCSCGWKGGPGASRFLSERIQWDKHAAPAGEAVRTVVTPEELATAKRLGWEAHEFGCPAPIPAEDAEFQRLVRELPEHVAPAVLVNMYARGYAERAEKEAAYLETSQAGRLVHLEVAEKVAELNPATEWAVDSWHNAIASAGRTIDARRAEAAAGHALADDTTEEPAPAADAEDEGGAGTIYTAPMEWYAPQVDSDDDADITIMHDHEDGTVLHGSRRGDGVYEIAKAHGFDWRRNVGIFIPRSRDQFSQLKRIRECADALRLAGHTVAVMVDDVWRPAAVREEARGARVTARVERLTARSLKQNAAGDARREAARQLIDMMPFGEPVKMDHYSAPRHLRAFERIENNQRAAHAAYDYAQHLASRADGAANNEDAKQGPRAIMRRIERLEADQREAQRRLDEAAGARAANSARYWWLNLERITEDIAYQRAKLGELAETGAFVAWGPDWFAKDDEARVSGRWYRVVRVSAKSLSLDGLYTPGYVERAKWDTVHGRRRDGVQLDTPNGKPRDIAQAKRVERWEKLTRHLTCASYNRTPEEESKRRHFAQARRVVLGLARTATFQEVAAFGEPAGEEEQHARALAMLAAFERLEAGETFDQVAADTRPLGDTAPAWTMPEGEPERVHVRDLVPGDIVCGVYDRFAGAGERLVSSMVGPVTAPAKITDRRESGEWYALEVDGETYEGKTFRRVGAHLVGAR